MHQSLQHRPPPFSQAPQTNPAFRQSPIRLPQQLPPFPSRAENGLVGAGGYRGPPSNSNSPRPGPAALHDASPPVRPPPTAGPSGRPPPEYGRERYEGQREMRSPVSPMAEASGRMHSMQQQHRVPPHPHPSQMSPPLAAGARPTFGHKPYSDSPPNQSGHSRAENGDPRRPNINIPALPPPPSNNTIAIQAPSPTPFHLSK